jgi:hypothetical protein
MTKVLNAGNPQRRGLFRFKTIFGDRLQTRQIDNQFEEFSGDLSTHHNYNAEHRGDYMHSK